MDRKKVEWDYLSISFTAYWMKLAEDKSDAFCFLLKALMELNLAGHLRLDLHSLKEDLELLSLPPEGEKTPTHDELLDAIEKNGNLVKGPLEDGPFVLMGESVYLRTFYKKEAQFVDTLKGLLKGSQALLKSQEDSQEWEELWSLSPFKLTSRQKEAAMQITNMQFLCLTGGPGTGKTTALAAMLRAYQRRNPHNIIRLASPTGRGAQRMVESLRRQTDTDKEPFFEEVFDRSSTIHKLLGIGRSGNPQYHRDHPLDADLIVIDEASMMNIEIALWLFQALAPGCSLVLVGDPDQLPSVEGGALFGDLVGFLENSPSQSASLVKLDRSHRSSEPVLELASAVLQGDARGVKRAFESDSLHWYSMEQGDLVLKKMLQQWKFYTLRSLCVIDKGIGHWKEYQDQIDEAFRRLNNGWFLSPERKGYWGVTGINQRILRFLDLKGSTAPGIPLMITLNDYENELFNGDKGIIFHFAGIPYVFFPDSSGYRFFTVARLPSWEYAYASTIHKSQGSESANVLVVLPSNQGHITRELLYTALTRAQREAGLLAEQETLSYCLGRGNLRRSGIMEALEDFL